MASLQTLVNAAVVYCAATKIIEVAGQSMVQAGDRIYYNCPRCKKIKYVSKTFHFFKGFICFECQRWMGNSSN